MKRNVYLNAIELEKVPSVLQTLLADCNYTYQTETITVKESLHRTVAESLYANISSPSYNASAMDGVALQAIHTKGANESNPVTIRKTDFVYINTGNVLPNTFDAVVMIEDVFENNDQSITLYKSIRSFENVRPIGEDITKGDLIFPIHHKIRPIDISAMISAGFETIKVVVEPKIAIIPTGDEIVSELSRMKKGSILDSNSYYVQNELAMIHLESKVQEIQADIFDVFERNLLSYANDFDILLVIAGSSAGSKDFVKSITKKNGEVYAHGVNMKPGRPVVIGRINQTPLIGLPGYPVSTYMVFEQVVKPLLSLMLHSKEETKKIVQAKLVKKVYSSLKNHEFVRVALGKIKNELVAIPLDRKAGATMSLVKAEGIVKIPKNSEGYLVGEIVDVMLVNEYLDVDNSLVVIGSHDILFDMLQDELVESNIQLISNHVGSFGGIMSIHNNECHIAPVHMLSPNGVYNEFILKKYLSTDYVLVEGVKRNQGIYVKKGNPKKIKTISDLSRISFVNRQRGSGTRLLLDHLLEKEGIDSNQIKGYEYELSTHILVAESVKDERFDAGLGVESVAHFSGVDFIKIGEESYDYLVRKDFLDSALYKTFIQQLNSNQFRKRMENIGGYLFGNVGRIIK